MTVAELIETLSSMPPEAVVLIDSDGGLSLVSTVEHADAEAPGLPSQVLLLPSFDE